jgi:ABC-type branched-subunit amino acid transport system substrate-binding protein
LQVALKSHVLLLTPGSTDVSSDRANVPWLFSLPPSDDALAAAVVPALAKEAAGRPFAVAASADHDGHAALAAFRRELGRHHLAPAALIEFSSTGEGVDVAAARMLESAPGTVLVLGPARSAGAFVAALRRAGFAGAMYGSATSAGRAFQSAVGDAAFVRCAPGAISRVPAWDSFSLAYERRWREPPDEGAANSYDAVRLVVDAIRRAGLNRARIRDAVRAASPWEGVGGTVRWDPLGRNQRSVAPCLWSEGRLVAARPDPD